MVHKHLDHCVRRRHFLSQLPLSQLFIEDEVGAIIVFVDNADVALDVEFHVRRYPESA